MAIYPNIALGVQSPQIDVHIPQPLQQFGQILTLRDMMQRGQLGQVELQSRLLALQQMQQQIREQQDYAALMKAYVEGRTATPSVPPVGTQATIVAPSAAAPFVPPGGTQPAIGPVAPAVSPDVAPWTAPTLSPWGVPGEQAPTLHAMMSPPAAQAAPAAQPPATVPIAQLPATGSPGMSRLAGMTAPQFLARFPTSGVARLKEAFALDQAEAEAAIKQHDAAMGIADELGRAATAVRDSKDPARQFVTEVTGLANRGLIPWETAQKMVSDGYDAHKNDIDAFIAKAQNAKDYSETQKNNIVAAQDKRKLAQGDYAQVNDQPGHEQFLARYPELGPVLGGTFSPGVKGAFLGPQFTEAQAKADKATTEASTAQRALDASTLAAVMARAQRPGATPEDQNAVNEVMAKWSPERRALFLGAKDPREVMHRALNPEQYATQERENLRTLLEAGRLKVEREREAREQKTFDLTLGEGANPYLVGVDPKLRQAAAREAFKIGDDHAKAQAAADQFQSFVDLARKGNKAAFSNLPLVGVETLNAINGIKRINKAEIDQYGAGSLYDKIVGKIGGLTQGQTIPAGVLEDMETLHKTLREGSTNEYRKRIGNLNSGYRSSFPTEPPGGGISKTVKMKAPDGTVRDVPADQADHYKSLGATVVQ